MTNRVYAFDLQGLELPASPPALAAGASREDRARYREAVSDHRKQVRTFCDSLAAELAGTGRPPLRSYLHAGLDGKPLLVMSVFEDGADAAKELERPERNSCTQRTRSPAWRGRCSRYRPPSSTRQSGRD